MSHIDFTSQLHDLMQRVGISSFKALSRTAGVSEHQLLRLRRLGVEQMRVDVLFKLAQALQITFNELVTKFSQKKLEKSKDISTNESQQLLQEIAELKKEYERSQQQMQQQRQVLLQEFQQSSLQLLESLLLQFPTAAHKARENSQLSAINIVPLVQKPLDRLLQQWGVEAIAPVGAELPYDPQVHQLLEGTAQVGELVKVRYIGYHQADKLLYRAKVSPIPPKA
ncbi:MAG: nucleotide exchange factor GrpE [Brasilonema octagenarum HA4186-MV1]|jgi:molecular chaperone GrpE (heat shock protein)|uniref:Nucleotide exchange factor GrpE n=2 Tax=Brasilonema TaxID=383614 RepID=A0A856MF72_9CYAN|nr:MULTISPECIES: nucleotide exchange factor GrpE [Brasilonema]MBW4628017.1 nucleotide exchange factor GrpE [Brasilonema octagenarum HA4186-MV1]NMF62189.1 nucleotide exchange factor GrpE [Brasilonema octagenarum UFV-OR1]QDL08799.1 nucleotide exchange factor GrpE [Brasilonema sennae CENA114]QDL15157.1 nucleotide exchange factor GrpE [Brasilonema octagenarum UFV-E1]